MINIAEKLSEEFIYVRIDLYTIDEQIFFGEMTFTPCAGCGKFLPEEYDYFFGRLIDISCHEKFKIESN
jgi:hypothetical protein